MKPQIAHIQKGIAIALVVFLSMYHTKSQAQINLSGGNENDMYTKAPNFKWNTTLHDFGKMTQNKPQTFTFTFTNTGNAPLVISQAKGSCECTKAEFIPTPIPPGKTGWVKATYDASKVGEFNRNVTVTANIDGGPVNLNIKGVVIAKK
jgi:hypothetical protein